MTEIVLKLQKFRNDAHFENHSNSPQTLIFLTDLILQVTTGSGGHVFSSKHAMYPLVDPFF